MEVARALQEQPEAKELRLVKTPTTHSTSTTTRSSRSPKVSRFLLLCLTSRKCNPDEIPLVLLELNESALIYIQKDQFENALLLLQKAHGVLDVVDLTRCARDQYISLQVFYNMAMCYQKLGQLQECALCLETCLDQLNFKKYQSLKDKSISSRVHKLKFECRLHL